jgi:2'-5' RNA ligase
VPRLFIGTLADIQEQKRTEQFLAGLKEDDSAVFSDTLKIKFSAAQNLHMTWVFIGDVPQPSIKALTLQLDAQMAQIRKMKLPRELAFGSIDFWPDEIHPRLLVLTPTQTPAVVRQCAQAIHHLATGFQSAADSLPFRAHITLARLKEGAPCTDVIKAALSTLLPFELKLTDIGLFESTSVGRQSVYRTVARYDL